MSFNLNSRKTVFLSSFIFITLLFLGCKNFFNGEDFLIELENSIEYQNETYADITISSLKAATESILPSTGYYNDKYKKNDSFNLEFVPTSSYQFVKWTATPAGSIEFENEQALSTTAKIVNTDESIKIEPLVYERAKISMLPGNAVENPRNSTIVISSSFPLNLTQEALNLISITVDGISVKEKYSIPKMDDNSKIFYEPKRDDYIDVPDGSTKTVVVTIPKDIYYEKDGVKVYLEDDFVYSFKINSSTETSAEITISCPASQGDISFSGTKIFYLDDEMSVTVTPNQAYILNDWNVKYNDETNTDVEDNILFTEISEDKKTIKIKLLTGTTKKISITPDIEIRGFVNIRFSAVHGSISPSEDKKYYVGESFNVTYRESGSYSFTSFAVEVSNKEDSGNYISIEEISEYEIKCTVLKGLTGNDYISIYASDEERPSFAGFYPDKLTDVNRDTSIKVFFTQSMSDSSIYWTEDELKKLLGDDLNKKYELLPSVVKTGEKGETYYYAYQEKGNPDALQYKNIEIKDRSKKNDNNLLKYFNEPCFENEDNETLIILSRSEDGLALPSNTNVDVKISGNFTNNNLIKIDTNLQKMFITSRNIDSEPPVLKIDHVEISGMLKNNENADVSLNLKYNNEEKHEIIESDSKGNFKDYIFEDIQAVENYKNLPFVKIDKYLNHEIKISVKGTITDEESKPDFVKVSLIPIKSDLKNQYPVEYSKKSDALVYNKIGQTETEKTFEFNLKSEGVYEGAYKIVISAFDKMGHERIFDKTYAFVYDDGNTPNVYESDIVYPEGTINYLSNSAKENYSISINSYNKYLKIKEDTYSNNSGPIFKLNLHNCEYCVYPIGMPEYEKQWKSCEEEYKLEEIYEKEWWMTSNTQEKKCINAKIAINDIFGNKITEKDLFFIYADNPSLLTQPDGTPKIEIVNDNTFGSLLVFTVNEKCSPLEYLELNINDDDNEYEVYTDYVICNGSKLNFPTDFAGSSIKNTNLCDENGNYKFSIPFCNKCNRSEYFNPKKCFNLQMRLRDQNYFEQSYNLKFYPYKVKYSSQNAENNYIKYNSDTKFVIKTSDVDDIYTDVEPISIAGYKPLPFEQMKIADDGSTEIEIKYNKIVNEIIYRDQYDKTFSGEHDNSYAKNHTFGDITSLDTPERQNYIFEGWYLTSDCSGTPITYIGKDEYLDDNEYTIYAKWTMGFITESGNLGSCLSQVTDKNQTYTIRFKQDTISNTSSINTIINNNNVQVILDFSDVTIQNSIQLSSCYISEVKLGEISKINLGAFSGCTNLQKVELSENIITIESHAFNNCNSLLNITIPKNVTKIGNNAFSNCDNLTEIIFEDTDNWYYTSVSNFDMTKLDEELKKSSPRIKPFTPSNPKTNATNLKTGELKQMYLYKKVN